MFVRSPPTHPMRTEIWNVEVAHEIHEVVVHAEYSVHSVSLSFSRVSYDIAN